MKYILVGKLCTDGDFSVDLQYTTGNVDLSKYITYNRDGQYYRINITTDDYYLVRDFLEGLIVSYRVGTHYWLIPDLYEFTDKILTGLDEDRECNRSSQIHGNYYGTYLSLVVYDDSNIKDLTVKDLKDIIKDLPDDMKVVVHAKIMSDYLTMDDSSITITGSNLTADYMDNTKQQLELCIKNINIDE